MANKHYYLSHKMVVRVKVDNECGSAFKIILCYTNVRYLYPLKVVIIPRFYHHI